MIMRPLIERVLAITVLLLSLLLGAQAQIGEQGPALDWRTFVVPEFGTSVQYPAGIFAPAGTMPASSPKPAPGHPTAARSQQNSAAADQPSTNRMPHQRPKIARTQNAARKEVSSNHRSGDERGSGRDNDNRTGQLGHAYARDGSAGPAGFWAWSW